MKEGYSSAIQLTGVSDYIPSTQECIKPLENEEEMDYTAMDDDILMETEGLVTFHRDEEGVYEVDASGDKKKLKAAEITLADCLACSGCVTSAESVLVNAQSITEFQKQVKEAKKRGEAIWMSVSPQVKASIAAHYDMDIKDAWEGIIQFLQEKYGADRVMDTNRARQMAHYQMAEEFIRRYKEKEALPMLVAVCPGFVCYMEKNHGDFINNLSKTKSPQAIMGQKMAEQQQPYYHAAFMPCYDKKLEASRKEFANPEPETAIVLTATELIELMDDEKFDLQKHTTPKQQNPSLFKDIGNENMVLDHQFIGSGGYLEYVMVIAAKVLFDRDVKKIVYKKKRNNDFQHTEIVDEHGNVLLKFAKAYGFRNIQNIVRQLESQKSPYHFVEVMACPSGCNNGGGQLGDASENRKERVHRLENVEKVYRSTHDIQDATTHVQQHLKTKKLLQNETFLTTYNKLTPERDGMKQRQLDRKPNGKPVITTDMVDW
mmetsp:Transcript_7412/g.10945  ORF Transcript_7412/g.10945 Transcript_7412/m.10945 type:complete len:488 (+) Transcript_7412:54-1517(+)